MRKFAFLINWFTKAGAKAFVRLGAWNIRLCRYAPLSKIELKLSKGITMKPIRLYTSFLLILFVQAICFAADGKLSGIVKDSKTGEPLIGANVILEGVWHEGRIIPLETPRGAVANLEGFYFILNVPPENYVVKASMMGYDAKQIKGVRIDFGRTITLDFELEQAVLEGQTVTVVAQKEPVKLDVSSSQLILDKAQTDNLPVNDVQEILNLSPGVAVNTFNNKIDIRGGGSDQVMAYLDGFSLKDNVFNVPFLSYNRTSIEEITIQTGGFLAEYGDLRSGIINVLTSEGSNNYSFSFDSRYSPPGYEYSGPKKYLEDKNYLKYGSDISMDSVLLAQTFPLPKDKFIGWVKFAEQTLADNDSSNDMTPNQRRELWRWQHRGRPENQVADYIVDATFSGPMPGRSLPILGPLASKTYFMLSHRRTSDGYEHPSYRDKFIEKNSMLKLNYHISPDIRLGLMGMLATESGMGRTNLERGDDAYVMRTDGGGTYGNSVDHLGDIKTVNLGLSFTHTISSRTFYEIRASQLTRDYNFRAAPRRDSTLIKSIPAEYYEIQANSLKVLGYWDPATQQYVAKDTTLHTGDKIWCPGYAYDETPDGWITPGDKQLDQTGALDLNDGAPDKDFSDGSSFTLRGDLTSQPNKYHQIKTGFYYNQNRIHRDWYEYRSWTTDRAIRYTEFPRYGAVYFQDRIEMKSLVGNFGGRIEYFDGNTEDYTMGDPFRVDFFIPDMWSRIDTLQSRPSKKYWRVSPRLGISHPMTVNSKIYFNYGHAYNSPTNTYRYGFLPHNIMTSPVEWMGNPNLMPQKTVQYELGYEQVLLGGYLIHTAIYYKDVTHELGEVFYQNAFAPDPTRWYRTWQNKAYQDIIGWEFRLYKQLGTFLTGWMQTEFRGQKRGEIGFSRLYVEGDPNNVPLYSQFSYPDEVLWDWIPSVIANIDLHSPSGWGPKFLGGSILGGWRINAILSWAQGAKGTWNPKKNPNIRNNIQGTDSFTNDFFISKTVSVMNQNLIFYCDIHNLFSRTLLNVGLLDGSPDVVGSEAYNYYASLKKGDRVGHYKASHLVYPKSRPGENYYYRVGGPVKVFAGLRFNLN